MNRIIFLIVFPILGFNLCGCAQSLDKGAPKLSTESTLETGSDSASPIKEPLVKSKDVYSKPLMQKVPRSEFSLDSVPYSDASIFSQSRGFLFLVVEPKGKLIELTIGEDYHKMFLYEKVKKISIPSGVKMQLEVKHNGESILRTFVELQPNEFHTEVCKIPLD